MFFVILGTTSFRQSEVNPVGVSKMDAPPVPDLSPSPDRFSELFSHRVIRSSRVEHKVGKTGELWVYSEGVSSDNQLTTNLITDRHLVVGSGTTGTDSPKEWPD